MSDKPEEISGDPAKESSPLNVSRETSGRRSRTQRSSVYVYLAVLFGAAFLMLLLAYFIQQRNNAAVRSDLRITTASREELLENIKALEEKNSLLQKEQEALETQLAELQQQKAEEYDRNLWTEKALKGRILSWENFWQLEQAFRNGDYEDCASFYQSALLSDYYATPPETAEQVESIYAELMKRGLLDETAPQPSSLIGSDLSEILY